MRKLIPIELMIQLGFNEKKKQYKYYKACQYIKAPFVVFFMQAFIFSITKEHDNYKRNKE
ncbi:hypothetical protein SAMN04488553_1331 [Gramella sp. MAR_2010_147]|nr:hypothetical protein SAMN04488553_1331 [Gramella sp. MAR_2010_147]